MTNEIKKSNGVFISGKKKNGTEKEGRALKKIKEYIPLSLLVLTVFLLVVFSGAISASKFQEDKNIYLAVITIEIVVFALPAMIFCRFRGMDFLKNTNLRFIGFSKLPIVIFGLLFLVFSNILITLLMFSGSSPIDSSNTTISMPIMANTDIIGVILTFAVIPAVCEEFLFRCVLMSEFNQYGYLTAIVITSLLFAMIHFSLEGFIIYFFSGLVLGMVAYITRSVVASMLIHIFYNLYGLFIESEVWGAISRNVNIVLVIFIAVTVMLISLMVSLGEAQRMFSDYSVLGIAPPESYVNREEVENADLLIRNRRIKAIIQFVNPAFIIAIVIFVCMVMFF